MKKGWAAWLTGVFLLIPRRVLAAAETVEGILNNTERTVACWVLGICTVLFVLLVAVWSVKLRKTVREKQRTAAKSRK